MLSGHSAFSVLGMQSIFSIRKFEGALRLSSECARKCSCRQAGVVHRQLSDPAALGRPLNQTSTGLMDIAADGCARLRRNVILF